MRIIILNFILASLLASCGHVNDDAYLQEINAWRALRIDSLKGKTGWLNLAGLYWLDPGDNSFGSDSSRQLIFPSDAAPDMGILHLYGDTVAYIPRSEDVRSEGAVLKDTTVVYITDSISKAMNFKNFSWFVIKRGNRLGVRLRDYNNPLISKVNHIDAYPTDANYKVEAQWEAYDPPKSTVVHNQVGMDLAQNIPGALHFKLFGKKYILEPIGSADDKELFVMIYDKTSGKETYGSGRYLYVDHPNKYGLTFIDFNKAYNPPCAFTPYATCLFPHETNRLPIAIKAGEKFSGH